MAELTFLAVRPWAPTALAVEFNETSALAIVKWCGGTVRWTGTELELKIPPRGVPVLFSYDPHPPGHWLTALEGDWILFDGEWRVIPSFGMRTDWEPTDKVTIPEDHVPPKPPTGKVKNG